MTAYVVEEHGGPDVFTETTRPVPEPGPDEVRVEVAATSLNPVDYKIRSGAIPDATPEFPATLHCDVAGVVDAVGADVDRFAPGDEVFGLPGGAARQGVLADYAVGHADTFARPPESIPLDEAAALPIVGLTAWEMLTEKTTVEEGDEVLVYGGSGGVGHVGVQLADHYGAEVTATGSTEAKRALAADLGAEATVDYTTTEVAEYVAEHATDGGFDVVFDSVGDDHLETAIEAVGPFGSVVTCVSHTTMDVGPLQAKSLSLGAVLVILPLMMDAHLDRIGDGLARVADLVDRGAFEPHVDRRFAFDEVADAHRLGEDGDFMGKLLLVNE